MSDKMWEAIIQFGQDNPSLDLDFRLHTHGKYLTQEKAIVASRAFKAGAAWQAAQAESVPVVGEVVDYDDDIKKLMRFYAVNDLISLSRIQSEHIARLQKKLPTMRDEQPRNPRSGGE